MSMNINSVFSNIMNNAATGGRSLPPLPKSEYAQPTVDAAKAKRIAEIESDSWLASFNNGTLKTFNPQSVEEYTEHLRSNVSSVMERLGMTLDEDEQLELSIGEDNLIKVNGLKDPAKKEALEKELNTAKMVSFTGGKESKSVGKNLYDNTFYINSDYAKEASSFTEAKARSDLIRLKNTAGDTIRKMTGVDLDFSQLKKDDSGSISGYPAELAWIFENDYSQAPQTDADKVKYATATSVKHIVNRLLDAGYDTIPNVGELGVTFRFGKNDISTASSAVPNVDLEA